MSRTHFTPFRYLPVFDRGIYQPPEIGKGWRLVGGTFCLVPYIPPRTSPAGVGHGYGEPPIYAVHTSPLSYPQEQTSNRAGLVTLQLQHHQHEHPWLSGVGYSWHIGHRSDSFITCLPSRSGIQVLIRDYHLYIRCRSRSGSLPNGHSEYRKRSRDAGSRSCMPVLVLT